MPWTKINYPASMKKLSAAVRTKAIEIANAMLRENKKLIEGIIIATAIKHAKDLAVKSEKKIKSAPKKKTKVAAKKKIKSAVKGKVKSAAKKKIKSPAKKKAKSVVRKETIMPVAEKIKIPVTETAPPETVTPAEDLHSAPGQGGMHPVTTLEAHQIENGFHHREEVSFQQENQKVKAAMSSRKNSKKNFRFMRAR